MQFFSDILAHSRNKLPFCVPREISIHLALFPPSFFLFSFIQNIKSYIRHLHDKFL